MYKQWVSLPHKNSKSNITPKKRIQDSDDEEEIYTLHSSIKENIYTPSNSKLKTRQKSHYRNVLSDSEDSQKDFILDKKNAYDLTSDDEWQQLQPITTKKPSQALPTPNSLKENKNSNILHTPFSYSTHNSAESKKPKDIDVYSDDIESFSPLSPIINTPKPKLAINPAPSIQYDSVSNKTKSSAINSHDVVDVTISQNSDQTYISPPSSPVFDFKPPNYQQQLDHFNNHHQTSHISLSPPTFATHRDRLQLDLSQSQPSTTFSYILSPFPSITHTVNNSPPIASMRPSISSHIKTSLHSNNTSRFPENSLSSTLISSPSISTKVMSPPLTSINSSTQHSSLSSSHASNKSFFKLLSDDIVYIGGPTRRCNFPDNYQPPIEKKYYNRYSTPKSKSKRFFKKKKN